MATTTIAPSSDPTAASRDTTSTTAGGGDETTTPEPVSTMVTNTDSGDSGSGNSAEIESIKITVSVTFDIDDDDPHPFACNETEPEYVESVFTQSVVYALGLNESQHVISKNNGFNATLTEFSCVSITLEVVLTGETLDVVLENFDSDIDSIEAALESDDLIAIILEYDDQGVFDTESLTITTSVEVETINVDNDANNQTDKFLTILIIICASVMICLLITTVIWYNRRTKSRRALALALSQSSNANASGNGNGNNNNNNTVQLERIASVESNPGVFNSTDKIGALNTFATDEAITDAFGPGFSTQETDALKSAWNGENNNNNDNETDSDGAEIPDLPEDGEAPPTGAPPSDLPNQVNVSEFDL